MTDEKNNETVTFGYAIVYVDDVSGTVDFYERAFGLRRKFVSDDGLYGELDTGSTTLSISSYEMADTHLPAGVVRHDPDGKPAGVEIALVTDDVERRYQTALDEGATAVAKPEEKSWGQVVSWVRDPNGVLIEICSPIG
jgi:lactoylglutathione lyase